MAITLHEHVQCRKRIPDDLAKDPLAGSRDQVAKHTDQEVGHGKAENLTGNDIVGLRGITLQIRCIGNKSAATGKSEEEELEDQPGLFGAFDG